jgi:serine/threonine-protein kinase
MTSTRDGKVVRLGVRGIRPIAFVDDLLVYVQVDGTVMAVPVDLGTRKVRGPAVPVHEPIDVEPSQNGNSAVAAGAGGGLITQSNGQAPTLAWFARGTGVTAIMREARLYGLPRLSPDGRRIAVGVGAGFDMQIWTLDLVTGTFSKLSALRSALWPSWLPDSKTVVYVGTDDGGKTSIYSQGVDAGAPARVIVTPSEIPGSVTVSPDGSRLLFASLRESGWDIFDVAIGDSQPRSARAYLSTSAQEFSPRFSPDGRWVAVNSNESGRYEVYVRSYPDPSVRVQVSTGTVFDKGADVQSAVWSADGKKLYYPGSSGATMVANVSTENGFRVISRDSIPAPKSSAGVAQSMFVYDEARDGQLLTLVQQPGSEKLVYVPNWATELRARIAASKAK